MASYRLSRKAAADLEAIATYTIEQFGIDQARRYRDSLGSRFEQLVESPKLGRRAEQLARGLRRLDHESHIVFYTVENDDVLIVRILHSHMDVSKRF